MKALINKQGFDYSGHGDFGNLMIGFEKNEFIVSVNAEVPMPINMVVDEFYYCITDDGYLQIARWSQYSTPFIIAQFQRTDEPLKEQILGIMQEGVKDDQFFTGSAMDGYEGGCVSVDEFNTLLKNINPENPRLISSEVSNEESSTIERGVEKKLRFCFNCDRFYTSDKKRNEFVECPRCRPRIDDEKFWQELVDEAKMIDAEWTRKEKFIEAEEARIDSILHELKALKTQQERIDEIAFDIQSGRNKYKEVSDIDVNLIFELLCGVKLEFIEREQEVLSLGERDIRQRLIMMNKDDAIEVVNEVCFSYTVGKDISCNFERCDDLDYIDIELCIKDGNELTRFYEAYIEWNRDEQISVENYFEVTRVSLEASDGFVLNYVLDWTEGEPELADVQTPYSELD